MDSSLSQGQLSEMQIILFRIRKWLTRFITDDDKMRVNVL